MHGVRAGDPVEEQQPLAVVDLVLERAGLEGLGLDRDLGAACRAAGRDDDTRRPASRRRSGRGRSCSPRAAFSLRLDATTSALQSTKVPWCWRVLGCAETSTQNTCAPTPTCGAARPTQPGETRIVATRSAASWTTSGAVGSTRSPTAASTSAGARTTSSTRPLDAELGLGPGEHGRLRRHRSSASAARSVAPTPSAAATPRRRTSRERVDVGAGRQVDLGDEQVEVAGEPGGEVGDVAADRGHLADHGRDDAGPVAAVDGEHPRRAARARTPARPAPRAP